MNSPPIFNLIVRDNLEQTQDDFGQSDVRSFQTTPVICGTADDCSCLLQKDADTEASQWFCISQKEKGSTFQLTPLMPEGVFLNQDTSCITGEQEIISGDTIRVGHYTFRFQRARQGITATRKSDILSTFTKAMLALIFILELGLVYWLPRKLQESRLLAKTVLSQKTMREIDLLRKNARDIKSELPDGVLPSLACDVVAEELDQLSLYIHKNQKYLTSDQWQQARSNLSRIGLLLKQTETGALGAPLPVFDQDKAVEIILEKHNALP